MSNYKNNLVTPSRRNHTSSVPVPTRTNSDDIAILSDEDLMGTIAGLVEQHKTVCVEKCDPRPWEEELCYYRREAQIRRKRKTIHDDYLANLSMENKTTNDVDEKNLPYADLDNSSFIIS